MKIRLFLMVFCVLLCVGELSAQKHVWTEVSLPEGTPSIVSSRYIDYSSIRRLPNGNVTYWRKALNEIFQTEVNCVTKEERTLKKIQLATTDSYGNHIGAEKDVTIEADLGWNAINPDSISDRVNGAACRSAKSIAIQPAKSAMKKIVKKKLRRKQ
jgi:hypothetical protein